jgi:FkbM family methyltransferase
MMTENRWRISLTKQFFDGWRQIYRFVLRTHPIILFLGNRVLKTRPTSMFLGDRVLTTTHHGHKIFLDPSDNDLTPQLLGGGRWEDSVERLMVRLLRPGQCCLDIGANIGYHTLVMAYCVGTSGEVHGFEPHPVVARLLRATIAVNGLADRVKLHEVALTDHDGEVTLLALPDHLGGGHVSPMGHEEAYGTGKIAFKVPARRLDDMFGSDAKPISLIKMDIEGGEAWALRGGAALLQRSPDVRVIMEWSPQMLSPRTDIAALVDWLEGLGMRFWRVIEGGKLQPLDRAALLNLPHSDILITRQQP